MHLATSQSAVLSAVIFNALINYLLTPARAQGRALSRARCWRAASCDPFIYGIGGIIVPFVGIKIIDMLLVALRLA